MTKFQVIFDQSRIVFSYRENLESQRVLVIELELPLSLN